MKRIFVTLSSVSALFFTSCDNENITTPEPLGTVTINGAIYSDLDEEDTDGIQYEKVLASAPVYLLDGETEALLATTTNNDTGFSFTLQIGASHKIIIMIGDFTTNINVSDGAGGFETKAAIYNDRQASDPLVVEKGGTYIHIPIINQPTPVNFD
jgi:hypothetical protein